MSKLIEKYNQNKLESCQSLVRLLKNSIENGESLSIHGRYFHHCDDFKKYMFSINNDQNNKISIYPDRNMQSVCIYGIETQIQNNNVIYKLNEFNYEYDGLYTVHESLPIVNPFPEGVGTTSSSSDKCVFNIF